jgi:hypothetical protein
MSTNHMDGAPQHGWDDEQLLEWILNRDAVADQANDAGPTDPAVRARMEELTGFLSECSSALRDEQFLEDGQAEAQQREAELTARLLARTTREDLSWRGDLTLVGGFLRDRLSRSVVLRVAAASLLLHMAALPVLAYYVFLAPATPPINIDLIRHEDQYPAQPFPEDRAEPESPLEVDLIEEPAVREQDGSSEKER